MARWTIGSLCSENHKTGMSPAEMGVVRFQRKIKSPRWNAGAIDSEMTTMMGCKEFVASERPFQSMKAELTARRYGNTSMSGARMVVVVWWLDESASRARRVNILLSQTILVNSNVLGGTQGLESFQSLIIAPVSRLGCVGMP